MQPLDEFKPSIKILQPIECRTGDHEAMIWNIAKTKTFGKSYFTDIPSGTPVVKTKIMEDPIGRRSSIPYGNNIQVPVIMLCL